LGRILLSWSWAALAVEAHDGEHHSYHLARLAETWDRWRKDYTEREADMPIQSIRIGLPLPLSAALDVTAERLLNSLLMWIQR